MHRRLGRLTAEGRRALRIAVVVAVLITGFVPVARAHGEAFDVVIEAVNLSGDPTRLAYGIVLSFPDGHDMSGATVSVSATAEDGSEVEVGAPETTPGVYIADITLDRGSWRVVVDIETADSGGTVEFSEDVDLSVLTQPVVRVDTVAPDRQGDPVDAESSVFQTAGPPPAARATTDIRVEALVREAVAPLTIEYGVSTDSTDAAVSISAVSDESAAVGPVTLTSTIEGVFRGVLEYPDAATWVVTVSVDGSDPGTATFMERLPWPHYTTEAGFPKIKVNSDDPSSEGSLIEIEESPIFGAAEPSSTTVAPGAATTSRPASSSVAHDVVVSLPSTTLELGRQVGLRWLHLLSIGVWGASIGAIGLGKQSRRWSIAAIGGIVAVVATGTALMLWGAPTSFPGIFRWSELGTRLYGSSYQWAFMIKMAFVAIAVGSTALLVARSTRGRLAVAAGSMLSAAAVVVVVTQLHLFAHL